MGRRAHQIGLCIPPTAVHPLWKNRTSRALGYFARAQLPTGGVEQRAGKQPRAGPKPTRRSCAEAGARPRKGPWHHGCCVPCLTRNRRRRRCAALAKASRLLARGRKCRRRGRRLCQAGLVLFPLRGIEGRRCVLRVLRGLRVGAGQPSGEQLHRSSCVERARC